MGCYSTYKYMRICSSVHTEYSLHLYVHTCICLLINPFQAYVSHMCMMSCVVTVEEGDGGVKIGTKCVNRGCSEVSRSPLH